MTRLLALTLLIGFFTFLPSAFVGGEKGLFCTVAILFVLGLYLYSNWSHPVGCLVQYNTCGKQARSQLISCYTNARHNAGNCGANMARFLALTLLIGFFAFLPSASADGDNGLHIIPADVHQSASSGTAMLTLNASNIQVRAKWRLDGDSPFAITDNGELRLTAELSDPTTIVATVIVEDMFSELNRDYQNLAATAFITVEFIHGELRIINPPTNMLFSAFGAGGVLHTFQTSGGENAPTFRLYSASSDFYLDELGGMLSVGADAATGIYTLTVEVSDGAIIPQRATAMATVAVVKVLILKAKVSDRARDLHDFSAPYASAYSIVAGNDDGYFAIGKTNGVLSVQAWTPAGNYPLDIGIIYTFSLGIPPKVVVSAAVVEITDYPTPAQRKIYVLGGHDFYSRLNDVWSSVNGINWSLETNSAVWSRRDEHQALSHNGKIYMLGGYDGSHKNDVWSSVNGINWRLETSSAAWSRRYEHQALSHNGRIYVLSGYSSTSENGSRYRNDVWSSADGKNWSLETDGAGWAGQYEHQAVSHHGRLYVLGGGYKNDVWSSADGENWSLETAHAGWTGRVDHQALSHNGRLYVLGGDSLSGRLNDVWSSADGKNWSLETDDAGWVRRNDHQALSHNGRLYVLGGSGASYPYYRNDVWSSADGENWSLETDDAGWTGRYGHQAVVFPPNLAWLALPDTDEFTFPFGQSVVIHTFDAQYGDGNYTYKLLPDISGFSLSANGELSTDGTAATGEHTITVQVADGDGQATTWTGKVIII